MFCIGKWSCVIVTAFSLLAVSWVTPVRAQSPADQVKQKLLSQKWRLISTDKYDKEAKMRLSFKEAGAGALSVNIKRSRIKSQSVKIASDGKVTIKLVRSQSCGDRKYKFIFRGQTKTGFEGDGERDKSRCRDETSDLSVSMEPQK